MHFKQTTRICYQVFGGPGENHQPVASHWHTLSYNVVHLALIEIPTHNSSGDRHWLHKQL